MVAKSRYFLIVNLIAGQGRCKELFPKVKMELDRRQIQYDLHFTNEPMEAVDVAKMGIEAGFSHIVAMGGDGTVNEVANGLLGSDATLAVIPAGTGNDFVRMLGIPGNPMQAIDTLLDGTTRTIDLGQVEDDRYFVNGLGIGLDAQVARDVLKMERLRGAPAYITAAVREVFRFRAFPVTLSTPEEQFELTCLSVGVANGIYAGGGFKLAPKADIDDGLIDISALGDYPKLERLYRLPKVRAGKHVDWKNVTYRQASEVTISSPNKLIAHVDGEPYRLPCDSFTVRALPQALRVLVPTTSA
ncbi:diacylglycerol kinase family lipid kinase [Candidatus Bipolaricaulota bacterium]|nr:diacylglycerol kinase family lipid kinase [Candidatus Bipolaricaulota bacterium]